ncbi:MAG: hypothetical protein L0Y58_07600 [Verrucomicrobia subdivision 3 bacterium]|nr:hypothetical protein [Limisphaerales bacterium]
MWHTVRSLCLVLSALSIAATTLQAAQNSLIVALRGTATGEMRPMPVGMPGDDAEALCFDVNLIDLKTEKKIGSATDCLSNIREVGAGLALVGRTIFNFPEGHHLRLYPCDRTRLDTNWMVELIIK